jgi:hypothetical protein
MPNASTFVQEMTQNIAAQSVIAAVCVALVNILLAMLSFRIALRSADTKKFLSVVLGGMVVRIVGMLGALWFGLKIWNLHHIAFPLTLLQLYLFSMAAEIMMLHRRQLRSERKRTKQIRP